MQLSRFKQLLDAYGSAPNRWPPQERAAALALLETSTEAKHYQIQAEKLDKLLDTLPIPMPAPQLKARILAKIQPAPDVWQWLYRVLWGESPLEHILRPAVTLGIPALLGVLLGTSLTLQTANTENETLLIQYLAQNENTVFYAESTQLLSEWAEWQ